MNTSTSSVLVDAKPTLAMRAIVSDTVKARRAIPSGTTLSEGTEDTATGDRHPTDDERPSCPQLLTAAKLHERIATLYVIPPGVELVSPGLRLMQANNNVELVYLLNEAVAANLESFQLLVNLPESILRAYANDASLFAPFTLTPVLGIEHVQYPIPWRLQSQELACITWPQFLDLAVAGHREDQAARADPNLVLQRFENKAQDRQDAIDSQVDDFATGDDGE